MGRKPYKYRKKTEPTLPVDIPVITNNGIEEKESEWSEIDLCEKNKDKIAYLFTVRVTHPMLRKREQPTVESKTLGYITDQGLYKIYTTKNGWGQLEDYSWIMLEYTERIEENP